MNTTKIIAIVLISILILNMILFGIGKISDLTFWVIILTGFIITYILKKIKIFKGKT